MIASKNWVGVVMLISWLSQVVYLFPLPSEAPISAIENEAQRTQKDLNAVPEEIKPDKIKEYSEQAKKEIWGRWTLRLTLILFGVVASVLALKKMAFWRTAIILTSLCYLILLYDPGYVDKVGLLESYKLKWRLYSGFNDLHTFVYQDIVLPILYLAAIIFCFGKRKKSKGQIPS